VKNVIFGKINPNLIPNMTGLSPMEPIKKEDIYIYTFFPNAVILLTENIAALLVAKIPFFSGILFKL
jgi:hypothetical protein